MSHSKIALQSWQVVDPYAGPDRLLYTATSDVFAGRQCAGVTH